ncbi:hypothetical protein Tco_0802947 [Tanacetum coccineum]|uniref:Uncharacterized protein n=1 Tax=Tanacetum coccineum TaxID=301880 RepID=A0ABQ5A087_9ASTR
MAKKVSHKLGFQEEVDVGAKKVNTAEGVNTGSIKLSTVSEQVSTVGTKMSIPSPDKGQREGKTPMISEETYRPNGKLIYNSIMNGPYVRRMIPEPGDADREVPVLETFHEQTDDELTVAEIKQMEAYQAIQTFVLRSS